MRKEKNKINFDELTSKNKFEEEKKGLIKGFLGNLLILGGLNNIKKESYKINNNLADFKNSLENAENHDTYQEALIKLNLTKKDESDLLKFHRNMKITSLSLAFITMMLCLIYSTSAIHTLSFVMIAIVCLLTDLKHSIKIAQIKEQRLLLFKDFFNLVIKKYLNNIKNKTKEKKWK